MQSRSETVGEMRFCSCCEGSTDETETLASKAQHHARAQYAFSPAKEQSLNGN